MVYRRIQVSPIMRTWLSYLPNHYHRSRSDSMSIPRIYFYLPRWGCVAPCALCSLVCFWIWDWINFQGHSIKESVHIIVSCRSFPEIILHAIDIAYTSAVNADATAGRVSRRVISLITVAAPTPLALFEPTVYMVEWLGYSRRRRLANARPRLL